MTYVVYQPHHITRIDFDNLGSTAAQRIRYQYTLYFMDETTSLGCTKQLSFGWMYVIYCTQVHIPPKPTEFLPGYSFHIYTAATDFQTHAKWQVLEVKPSSSTTMHPVSHPMHLRSGIHNAVVHIWYLSTRVGSVWEVAQSITLHSWGNPNSMFMVREVYTPLLGRVSRISSGTEARATVRRETGKSEIYIYLNDGGSIWRLDLPSTKQLLAHSGSAGGGDVAVVRRGGTFEAGGWIIRSALEGRWNPRKSVGREKG